MDTTRPVTPPSDDESLTSGGGLPALVGSMGEGDEHDSPMADAQGGGSSHTPILLGGDSDDEGEEEISNNAGSSSTTNTTNLTSRRQTRGKQGAAAAGGGGGGGAKKFASNLSAGLGKALGTNWGGSKGKGRGDREEPAGGLGFSSGGGFETRDLRGGGAGGGGREEREKLVDEDEMDSLNRDIGDPFDESELVGLSRNPPQPAAAAASAPTPPAAPTSALSPSSQPAVAPVA